MIARSQSDIENLLKLHPYLNFTDRLALGVEHYIAGFPEHEHKHAWQKLPYRVQYLPMISYLGIESPDVKYVNPGLPLGGMTEYEKHLTYNKLPGTYRIYSVDFLDQTMPEEDAIRRRIEQAQISYPFMIKANKGERGVGIYYIPDKTALDVHFSKLAAGTIEREPITIQEYCDFAQEYCLQFFQYVDDAGNYCFELGELTLRDIPVVQGDGQSTVLALIGKLDISEQQRENIITGVKRNEEKLLTSIPSLDERISIVRTASIDFGTTYKEILLDDKQKEILSGVVLDILQNIRPDFMCVGRFDLKANSLEDVLSGDIQIIELNASGGMPTHVYDEKFTIPEKYQILKDHFDAYRKIAALNRKFYIPIVSSLLGLPEFVIVLSKSASKKGISIFKESKNKSETKKIYEHIFGVIKLGRRERNLYRMKACLLWPYKSIKRIFSHLSS